MTQFTYVIKDEQGMHARPAGLLVKQAGKYASSIKISANGKEVDAKRIFGIMSLGIKQGQEVTIIVDGDDEAVAAAELEAFMQSNL